MHFTTHHDLAIDAKVQSDLDAIKQGVLSVMGDEVGSILLTGGFGRGEGSVEVTDGRVRVINDYDILVTPRTKSRWGYARLYRRFHRRLAELAEALAQRLEMKQVDLVLKPASYFTGNDGLKIGNYEVQHGHYLLFGEEDPCQHMPAWRAEDIPLFEGTWLFRNRGLGLLIAGRYFIGQPSLPEANRENFVIECNKAQLAMGDSLLLLKRSYHHLYSERLRLIEGVDLTKVPNGARVAAHYTEALEQKLRPEFDRFYRRDLPAWWRDVVSLFDEFYRWFEAKRLGRAFSDWLVYERIPKPEDGVNWRVLAGNVVRDGMKLVRPENWRLSLTKARRSQSVRIVALLLFCAKEPSLNERYLQRAAGMLSLRRSGDLVQDWQRLTNRLLWLLHPAGEAGRVATGGLPGH